VRDDLELALFTKLWTLLRKVVSLIAVIIANSGGMPDDEIVATVLLMVRVLWNRHVHLSEEICEVVYAIACGRSLIHPSLFDKRLIGVLSNHLTIEYAQSSPSMLRAFNACALSSLAEGAPCLDHQARSAVGRGRVRA
jgi:hypothetical protein